MSPNHFQPEFSHVGSAAGTPDVARVGLGGVESQLTGTGDIGAAHQFFSGRMIGNIAPVGSAAMAAPMITGAEAAIMPVIPGANEPISPLIQLIMRMPGATGLINSFFECLGAFFLPQLHMFGLDPALFDLHAHVASLASHLGIGHLSFDLHLFNDGGIMLEDGGLSSNLLGVHKSMSGMRFSEGTSLGESVKVSGGPNLNSPKFEGMGDQAKPGELLSGPSMSQSPIGNHLASGHRMFSDRFQGTLFTKPGMNGSLLAGSAGSTTATVTNAATNTTLNVGADHFGGAFRPEAQSAVGQISDAAGAAAPAGGGLFDGAAFGKSVGADNNLLATNTSADSFRPSSGGQSADFNSSYLKQQPGDTATPASTAPHGSLLKPGLKAKELSLESVSKSSAQTAHKAVNSTPVAKSAPQPQAPAAKSAPHVEANHKLAETTSVVKHSAHNATPADKTLAKDVVKAPAKIASSKPFHIDTIDSIAKPHDTHAFDRIETQSTQPKFEAAAPKPTPKLDLHKTMSKLSQTKLTDNALTSDLKPGTYTIRSGDCLWNIAKDHLGSSLKWQDIYKLNQDVLGSNPQMIHSGVTIKMPGMPGGSNIASSAATEATKYVVKPGDCLWNIAKDQLHDATKWGELFKANSDIIGSNARIIMPGQELTIPGTEPSMVANAGGVAGDSSLAHMSDGATASAMAPQAPSSEFGSPATSDGYSPMAPTETLDAQQLMQQPAVQAAPPAPVVQQPIIHAAPLHTAPAAPVHTAPAAPTHVTPAALPNPLQRLIPTMQTGAGAAIPAPSVHVGPGAASAATLGSAPPITHASNALDGVETLQPVVKSSLGTDIQSFLSTRR